MDYGLITVGTIIRLNTTTIMHVTFGVHTGELSPLLINLTTICIAKHPHDFFVINTLSMWRNFVGHLEPFHLECNSKNSPTCSDRKLCILVLEMMLLIAGGSTRGREHHRKIFEYKVVRRYGIKNTCCRSPVHSESLSHAALS